MPGAKGQMLSTVDSLHNSNTHGELKIRSSYGELELIAAQPANEVRTTLLSRRFNILTSLQRPYNVILTSCAGTLGEETLLRGTEKSIRVMVISNYRESIVYPKL